MSELQSYYDAFSSGCWANPNPEACPCGGSGWALSEVDTWHECPVHYAGQPHPEDVMDGEAPSPAAAPPPEPAPLSEVFEDDGIPF